MSTMSSNTDETCCCMATFPNLLARRHKRLQESSPRPRPRCESSPVSRAGHQQAPWKCQTILTYTCDTDSRCEEIELKCYTLSRNCLLVESDKRCRLDKARSLVDFEDGRKHMDVGRPESMSLIKFKVNPESGQLERRLSIHEINQDNEFGSMEIECTDAKLADEQLAERLSSRSFVLIERTNQEYSDSTHGYDEVHEITTASQLDDSWEIAPVSAKETESREKLERTLISSISIEAPPQLPPKISATSEIQQKRKRKRTSLGLVRRLARILNSSSSDVGVDRTSLARDFGHCTEDSKMSDSSIYPYVSPNSSQRPDGADLMVTSSTQLCSVASMTRPESFYLWPSRLPTVSESQEKSPGRQYRQCKKHTAMISYNHTEGKNFAIALHTKLKQLGVSTYLDLYDIRKGDDWQDSLNLAILNCRVFIALVTPSYGETLWTSRECKLADVLGKRIIPINFGLKWPPPSLAIQFATLQYIDWLQGASESAIGGTELDRDFHDKQQIQLFQPAGPLVATGASWPSECVQSIACQLDRCIRMEFRLDCGPTADQHRTRAETSRKDSSGSNLSLRLAQNSPSPPSDSGYESPPIIQTRQTPPKLSSAADGNSRNLNDWSASVPKQQEECVPPASLISDSAELISPPQSLQRENESSPATSEARPHSRLTTEQCLNSAVHDKNGPVDLEAEFGHLNDDKVDFLMAQHIASQAETVGALEPPVKLPARRKISLGHRTKRVLSLVKRQLVSRE